MNISKMRRGVSHLPLALLFLAVIYPSNAQTEPAEAEAAAEAEAEPLTVYYDVGRAFAINCTKDGTVSGHVQWYKNGSKVEEWTDLKNRFELRREGAEFGIYGKSFEDDFGNYTCESGGARAAFSVRGRTHAKLPSDTNAVEGQKLKLSCRLIGKPYPEVAWLFYNETENGSDVHAVLGPRVRLQPNEHGVPNAELVVEEAARSDAGVYMCRVGAANGTTTLRVKDMYAALWPFLGICAEVFVLCAIILVYERRRTKPELDDSDTDNHDQKKS